VAVGPSLFLARRDLGCGGELLQSHDARLEILYVFLERHGHPIGTLAPIGELIDGHRRPQLVDLNCLDLLEDGCKLVLHSHHAVG
jgi:hypothetical protein